MYKLNKSNNLFNKINILQSFDEGGTQKVVFIPMY